MLDKVIRFIVSTETIFQWTEIVAGMVKRVNALKLSNRLIVGVAIAIVWVANKGSV